MTKKTVLLLILLLASATTISTYSLQNTLAQNSAEQIPTKQVTLYAGELYNANKTLTHGAFGLTATSLSSPGPTLYFTAGDIVNLTLVNIGKVGHSWAITDQPETNASRLFNATVANATNPVITGASNSITFTVGAPGLYYYICAVPGHVELGMWGTVIVGNTNESIVTLYAGELYDANNSLAHGAFSFAKTNLSSPGPTLYLTSGTTITVNLTNVGAVGHGWAITDKPETNATRLFNATIANATNPQPPGNSSSVRFTVGPPGSYYYICPVPGHVTLGMWGKILVIPNSTTTAVQSTNTTLSNLTVPLNATTTAVSGRTPKLQTILYAGELYDANKTLAHGAFGLIKTNLTSPAPTLCFTTGTTVNLTLVNVGKVGHSFAITDKPATNATRLFGAVIANGTVSIQPNNSSSVTFTVGSPGIYYYICAVPGHVELGMWGTVIVGDSLNKSLTLYAGELYDANNTLMHGAFALSPTSLSSPGPTLYLTSGSTVNLTLVDIGKVGHSFAITDKPATNATRLFNATIANGTSPLAPGNSSSIEFTVGSPGEYYYICSVPGHVELGMWGKVIVIPTAEAGIPSPSPSPSPSPPIPEMSPILDIIAIMAAITLASFAIARKRSKLQ